MSAFSVREFRPEDALWLEGMEVDAGAVVFGRTLLRDREPVAYGGVFFPFGDGVPWLFFHVDRDGKQQGMRICRACRVGLALARVQFGSLNTYLDNRIPRAREFLVWSGFEPTREFVEIDENQFEVWRMQ